MSALRPEPDRSKCDARSEIPARVALSLLSPSLSESPIDRLSSVTVRDPRARARRSLRSRAILHEPVTATGVDVDDALAAAANRTRTRIPLPRLLRHGRAAVRWVDVGVDIRLCIRGVRSDHHGQNAQAADHNALHDFSPIGIMSVKHALRVIMG